jgi:hypothetical protein
MAKKTDSHRTLAEDKADRKAAGEKKRGKIKTSAKQERYRALAQAYTNAADSVTYANAYQSALKAGYSPGYALGNSYKLVDKRGIQVEIEAIRVAAGENPKICSADEILEMLSMQARMLPNKLFNPQTKELINPVDMTDAQAQAIAGYKVRRRIIRGEKEGDDPSVEITYEFKLVDRQVALIRLGMWWGLFEKDNRQRAPTTPQTLVAFPTGVLSLEEWQAQAERILEQRDAEKEKGGMA